MASANPLTDPIVHDALAGMGTAGAIIFVLISTVIGLAGVIALLLRHSAKVYGYRLSERDTLKDALHESKTTMREMLEGMQERNEVTAELSDVISGHTAAFNSLKEKIELHYGVMREDNHRSEQVITAISGSLRAVADAVADVKTAVVVATIEVKGTLANLNKPQRRGS